MIRAGHERTRRNLHDTWALRRSQPLVSLGPSGLPRTLGGRQVSGQPGCPPFGRRSVELSTVRPHAAARLAASRQRSRVSRSSGRSPGRARVTWPSKLVRTSRPPTSSAAVTTSEWATRQATAPSGSMANVSSSAWTRTCASRDEPSSATIGVAERCSQRSDAGRGLEPVGVEAVADDQQTRRIPVQGPRLVVDERREADGPGAARTLEPELGAAQRLRIGGDDGPRSTSSPPASDSAKTSRPDPLPPHRQRPRRPPG